MLRCEFRGSIISVYFILWEIKTAIRDLRNEPCFGEAYDVIALF